MPTRPRQPFIPLFAAVLFAVAALAAAPAGAGIFNPETFTLQNGMQVVVVPNHRVPVVTHMVWYKVGAGDEQPGKSGIAHFFEHLMFKGTPSHPNGEFSQMVARNGGTENAFTSADYTAYHQTVAKDRLPLMMELEADRMTHLALTPEQVEPERLVILEERRMRTDNRPGAILAEHVNAALFLNYPYRIPIIGWAHEIKGLTIPDLKDFYHRWYAPNNAVLVVAGDITAAELRPLAEKTYGQIPRGPDITRRRPTEPPQMAARRVVLRDPRVGQPSWSRSYLAPSYLYAVNGRDEAADPYALEVLDEIMSGGATSRLYKALVVDGKLADNAGAYYNPGSLGPAKWVFHANPAHGVSMETLEKAVEAEVARLLQGGVTAAEVERAKKRMVADAVFARDSLRTGAQVLGAALAVGRTVADVEAWPERIGAVTPEQVMAAARAVLGPAHVTAVLLPGEAS
ncbi:MAG: insulinase family protein [Hyphomicrobiales bacterium]|nr:insulinase family protein [Hyphomicrobiales bacterium]MCP5371141.1 insulinase family protein [Hyphomicrobiales bacterium]